LGRSPLLLFERIVKDFEKDVRDGILKLRPISEQAFERARRLSQQTTARIVQEN
jgi:hypothetical protein